MLIYPHPPGVELTECTEPSAREHIVAVNVRPAALLSLLGDDPSKVPDAMRPMVESRSAGDFPIVQMSMTAEVFEIASRLLENPYEGPLGLAYTEAIATELLCAALGAVAKVAGQPSEQYTEREIRCLQAARAMLMRQLSKPPTIPQVARASGINETTLKRGFKAMFGETIFDFSVRCRMQHALALFRERGMSVAEVADAVGYRHQTSFATAFRRHFGMRPKDVRRTRST
jgi:AraC-like DNA-binding protein